MAKISRFEDLIAWQKGMALIRPAYLAARVATAQRDFSFANQIRRASVSVVTNIAEGFERGGRKEFHQFLSVAKGSAAEVRTLIRVAADLGYLQPAESAAALRQSEEVGRLLGGLRAAVGRQREIKTPGLASRYSLSPQSSVL